MKKHGFDHQIHFDLPKLLDIFHFFTNNYFTIIVNLKHFDIFFSFLLEPKRKHFVLPKCNDSLVALSVKGEKCISEKKINRGDIPAGLRVPLRPTVQWGG